MIACTSNGKRGTGTPGNYRWIRPRKFCTIWLDGQALGAHNGQPEFRRCSELLTRSLRDNMRLLRNDDDRTLSDSRNPDSRRGYFALGLGFTAWNVTGLTRGSAIGTRASN